MFIIKKRIELDVYMPQCFEDMQIFSKTSLHKKHYMKPIKENVSSISSCWGLIEMQKSSLCLRSWMDIRVEADSEQTNIHSSDPDMLIAQSHSSQSNGFAQKNNINIIKIVPPVRVRCKENVNFIASSSPFSAHDINIPSGVVNFKIQNSVNFFMYVPCADNCKKEINFNFGDPIVQFTPMSERKIHINYIYDDIEFDKATSLDRAFSFKNKAYKIARMKR